MLSEIIEHALASETDMTLVEGAVVEADDLGRFTRTERVDVVIFPSGAEEFTSDRIGRLLHVNPRLGLFAMDGAADRGGLHHLVPAHEDIRPLTRATIAAAIRTGAALRRR
jgi:hypothetical protein